MITAAEATELTAKKIAEEYPTWKEKLFNDLEKLIKKSIDNCQNSTFMPEDFAYAVDEFKKMASNEIKNKFGYKIINTCGVFCIEWKN